MIVIRLPEHGIALIRPESVCERIALLLRRGWRLHPCMGGVLHARRYAKVHGAKAIRQRRREARRAD